VDPNFQWGTTAQLVNDWILHRVSERRLSLHRADRAKSPNVLGSVTTIYIIPVENYLAHMSENLSLTPHMTWGVFWSGRPEVPKAQFVMARSDYRLKNGAVYALLSFALRLWKAD
jgi:hypothetical protein